MIGAASLTPTEREADERYRALHAPERHRAFHAKIAAKAVPDMGIGTRRQCVESVVVPETPIDSFAKWIEAQQPIQPQEEMPPPLWLSTLEERPAPDPDRRPSIIEIQTACAVFHGLQRNDLLSVRRPQVISRARQVAYFICKEYTHRSNREIGRMFGGRDPTTILYALQKIGKQILTDARLAADIQAIRDLIMVRG